MIRENKDVDTSLVLPKSEVPSKQGENRIISFLYSKMPGHPFLLPPTVSTLNSPKKKLLPKQVAQQGNDFKYGL